MVFVSLGAPRRERKGEGVQLPASCLPPPQKEHIPMLLLLQEPHLTTLFDLLEMLACFKPPSPGAEKLYESPDVRHTPLSFPHTRRLVVVHAKPLSARAHGARSFTFTLRTCLAASGSC